ncbi:MAG: NHL domain-containing thioredoxin family protein [Spirochaetaceae bacterium]|nr:NHL domain-containing thioredoxin family protein [Spirochaetaceae bacterium]
MRDRARAPHVRAPELTGRGWLNTGGREIRLADLRGKVVLLDFWTFCCINCLHVLDELRPLEEKYADVLVTVGVHSPKFAHEAEPDALAAAVDRYAVHHAVLDDPDLTTWGQYAVRAWPTLVVVDPEGYVVAHLSGEGHAHALDRLLADLVVEHDTKGTLHRGNGPYVPSPSPDTELRFPGKAIRLPGGTLLVSDSGHHSLVELGGDGETVLRRIGSGERGLVDGAPDTARFSEPQGLCLLPAEVRAWIGYDVVAADTVNHALRGVRLDTGEVRTIAGTGRQWMQGDRSPLESDPRVPLSSPWDVAWSPGLHEVVVAMAGIHQLWRFDPVTPALSVWAGTSNEGLLDGAAGDAWFAQTSGLASDGHRTWLVDAETSSLRYIDSGPSSSQATVTTVIGSGLFDFGHVDGPAAKALLQHPLGVTALPDGSVAVSDTYNGAVRRYDPATSRVTTLLTGLAEPSDALVDGDHLVVVESAAHRLTRLRLPDDALVVDGVAQRTHRPVVEVAPGPVALIVLFDAPAGQHLDERYGPATRLVVSSTPPGLIRQGEGRGTELTRSIVLDAHVGDGVLHVSAMAASCDDTSGDDASEFPACHVHQQDWGVPVRLVEGAPAEVRLHLAARA